MASPNLFLSDVNAHSQRCAVVEDDGDVAHLYLTAPGCANIVAAVWIYNRSTQPDPTAHEWTIIWSHNGDSVAVLADGSPLACIVRAESPGYSRGVAIAGPVAQPWDEAMFSQAFGRV